MFTKQWTTKPVLNNNYAPYWLWLAGPEFDTCHLDLLKHFNCCIILYAKASMIGINTWQSDIGAMSENSTFRKRLKAPILLLKNIATLVERTYSFPFNSVFLIFLCRVIQSRQANKVWFYANIKPLEPISEGVKVYIHSYTHI